MKFIFFTTLLLFSVNGFCQNWKKVTESEDGHSFYVDVDHIKKHNRLVYYWMLVDLAKPNYGRSSITKFKVDCEEEKQTELNYSFYTKAMGRGSISVETSNNNIFYPKPNSVNYGVMKFVCDYAK